MLHVMPGMDNNKPSNQISGWEEFMPFSCTELNQELIDYARIHLNETEEIRTKAIKEIKEFIKKEFKVNTEIPDILCLCFLRSRKFDIKRTCGLIRRTADFVESHRYLFDRIDPEAVRRTVQSNILRCLPYRDAKSRGLVLVEVGNWDPSKLTAEDAIFGCMVSHHIFCINPVNQVVGFVLILDCKKFLPRHVIAFSKWLILSVRALQSCCPCLNKEVHIVHASSVFKAFWKVVMPLLSKKMAQRIFIYKSSEWTKLHQRIDPRLLPEELGGHLGPYSNEHWISDTEEIGRLYHKRFMQFLDRNKMVDSSSH